MLLDYVNGQTSVVLRVKLRDSSVSTGAGLTGLTSASSGLRISAIADNEAAAVSYTVAGATIETITTLGSYAAPTATKVRFKEVDATNHPGVYEVHLADARFAVSSAKSLLLSISGATNLAQCDVLIPLRSVNPYSATAFMTSVASVTGAVGSVTGAVGSVTGAVGSVASGGITAASLASNAITSAKIATGAITAATFAANAIDAAALASDAAAEIAVAARDVNNTSPASSSLGAAVNSAASAGDPWASTIPGSYSAGTAGYIVGANLNASVSSRSTYAGGDTSGTTTLLSRVGSPATTVSGDIATVNASLATFTGMYTTGLVASVTSSSAFRITFSSTVTAADLVGLELCFRSSGRSPAKGTITGATQVDSLNVNLSFATAFSAAPSVSDTVLVI